MRRRWQGVLTIQGELASGSDRRIFDLFTWRTPPLTLRVQTEDFGGHDGASPVGTIDTVELMSDGRRVWGTGSFSESDPGQLAATWVEEGTLRGVSVDPGEYKYVEEITDADGNLVSMEQVYEWYAEADRALEDGDEAEYARIMEQLDALQWQLRFTSYEIAAATLVATPAFKDAWIEMVPDGQEPAAAAAAEHRTPAERLAALAPRTSVAQRLAALSNAGTLLASAPDGSTVATFNPGRTIAAPNARFLTAATPPGPAPARHASGPQTFHAEWMRPSDEVKANRTPWTITDEGRIMGYLYTNKACHRSFSACTPPPVQQSFPEFHIGEAALDDGTRLSKATGNGVGVLTFNDLHAGDGPPDPAVLQRLMEDTGTQLGPVRLYADEFGVQCCGQVYDDVTPALVARALAGFPSGD